MVKETSVDILFISLLVLFVILVVLVVLFWVYRHFKNRNLTLLKISIGQPSLQLAIRTKPEHAQHLMDHLLERFALQVETVADNEETVQETEQENVAASPVNSEVSKVPNIFSRKMSQLFSVALPLWAASKHPKSPSFHSTCNEIEDQDQPASSSNQAATNNEKSNEKKEEESNL